MLVSSYIRGLTICILRPPFLPKRALIRVGEETGALDKMLVKISDFYTKEVDDAIKTFTKLIEPLLIVLMTIVIGFIAISIFLPMADIMEGLHR